MFGLKFSNIHSGRFRPARLIWVLMVLAHMPGVISAWRALLGNEYYLDRLGACLALTAAMAFFVLKVRDVAWLRCRLDRRSWVAISLVVALIHVDLLRPDTRGTIVPECAAVLSTAAVVVGATPVRRFFLRARAALRSPARQHPPVAASGNTLWFDAFRPHCWLRRSHLFILRAPPA